MASRLRRDDSGAAFLEFTVVVPILFLVMLGLVDLGLLMFTWSDAGRATLIGARCVATSDPVATGIDGPVTGTLPAGNVCTVATGCVLRPTYTCMSNAAGTAGTCTGSGGATTLTMDFTRFQDIVTKMQSQTFSRRLDPRQVKITYTPVEQGFIGRSSTPMNVTVTLKCMKAQLFFVDAFIGLAFPAYPAADNCGSLADTRGFAIKSSTTLPSEDLSGTTCN